MSKKSTGIMLSLAIIICIGGIFYYYNIFARSISVATVTERGNSFIMIEKENGSIEKIKTTELGLPLIEVGKRYIITSYSNKLRSPFLKSIKPSDSHFDEELSEINGNIESINDENGERFSYLGQLSVAKQEAFDKFKVERELHYLYDFTPEDMVLVYLYSISVGDLNLIYAITYNEGLLPDQETFRNEYFEYASNHDSEIAVHYRYYESIEIDENTVTENKVTVVVTAGVGIMTHSLALGLQKEDKVWKMDTYHWINDLKKKASEVSE